jgi:hypothetical protein
MLPFDLPDFLIFFVANLETSLLSVIYGMFIVPFLYEGTIQRVMYT